MISILKYSNITALFLIVFISACTHIGEYSGKSRAVNLYPRIETISLNEDGTLAALTIADKIEKTLIPHRVIVVRLRDGKVIFEAKDDKISYGAPRFLRSGEKFMFTGSCLFYGCDKARDFTNFYTGNIETQKISRIFELRDARPIDIATNLITTEDENIVIFLQSNFWSSGRFEPMFASLRKVNLETGLVEDVHFKNGKPVAFLAESSISEAGPGRMAISGPVESSLYIPKTFKQFFDWKLRFAHFSSDERDLLPDELVYSFLNGYNINIKPFLLAGSAKSEIVYFASSNIIFKMSPDSVDRIIGGNELMFGNPTKYQPGISSIALSFDGNTMIFVTAVVDDGKFHERVFKTNLENGATSEIHIQFF